MLSVLCPALAAIAEKPSLGIPGAILIWLVWAFFTVDVVEAHGFRVLVRTVYSNVATLREGSSLLAYPEYVVRDSRQFGPWSSRAHLPLVGQVLDIDVPEVIVPVEKGLYCLRVKTKAIGTVRNYSVEDLVQSPIAIEQRIHDVIAKALRRAVYDKGLEDALVKIQRIFCKDGAGISAVISVPAFQVTQLLLDATEHVSPADPATQAALDIIMQRKQETAKQAVLEASMDTEERKVKLRRIAMPELPFRRLGRPGGPRCGHQ